MEKNMQPQVKTEEDKLVPIDTSGESMDIEIKDEEEKIESDEQQIEEKDVEDKSDEKKETSEEEEYSQNVKKRIDKLTYKLRESERREQEAINFAQKIKSERDQALKKVNQVDDGYLKEYTARVSSELDKAQNALSQAIEDNNAKAQVEAQRKIAQLTIEEERAKMTLAQKENQKKEKPAEQPQQINQSQNQAREPDPKAEAWAEKNSWFGQDKGMTYTAMAIHEEMINKEGFDGKSDEYYNELDKRIKKEFPHKFKDEDKDKSNRVVQTVASANRSTKSGRRTVRLTPSQIAIAKKLGVPLEEYAKHVKEA
jgi:hypothetical protein